MTAEVAPPASAASLSDDSTNDSAEDFDLATAETGTAPVDSAATSTTSTSSAAPSLSPQDDVDFLLHPAEVAKGRRAAENYLSSFRSEDARAAAEEALETLATVISGGKCDSVEFPWQQVRPYHGAAALTILKEKGAPARIEALRCRRDSTRSYRVVPDSYPPRQVQKIRSTLSKVIEECTELGFLESEGTPATAPKQKTARTKTQAKKASTRGRLLADGELRALVAASAAETNTEGRRDAVFFSLAYRGLKIAEITGLTLESVKFSNKTGVCSIVAKPARSGGRGRRVELSNDELIVLEDWLDDRGDAPGPLLCTLGKGGKVEGKRLTTAMLGKICELRAEAAEVPPFTPNDLSRSAEALTDHRKATRRRTARAAREHLSDAEKALYLAPADVDAGDELNETIQFPFLGLDG